MAIDKAVDSAVLDAGLKATANAIRGKTGDSALIEWKNADGFKAAVDAILAGGGGGGEGGYDFFALPTPFNAAVSGSFILDADTSCTSYKIQLPESDRFNDEKPVLALIFSDDKEVVNSTTVNTAQVLFQYDEKPRSSDRYKQRFGAYAYISTATGSYVSNVCGGLGKSGSDLVSYGSSAGNCIEVKTFSATNNYMAAVYNTIKAVYYVAGKKYYWLLLGSR